MKKYSKPNYYFFRPANFLADTHGMSISAVGALVRLTSHAWQRWNPETHPFPFLPNNESLLAKFCGNARSWKKVRVQVLAKLTPEDDRLYYAPHREDAENVRNAQTLKAEKKKAAKESEKPAAPPPVKPDTAPATPEKSWNEAPAPDGDVLVYGLQGFRAVGWSEMTTLLRDAAKLKEADCTLWKVTGSKVEQTPVTVLKSKKGFAFRLGNGQTVSAES
jgi:uncharacterized protein YdaU (DUF1376 family)